VHVDRIKEQFGTRRLDNVRPSEVNAWLVSLKEEGYAASYIYALHERMRQIYSDAVHDGLVARFLRCRGVPPQVRVGNARTWPLQRKSGPCTTPWSPGIGPVCCWPHSPV
jgi:hypothetical protein